VAWLVDTLKQLVVGVMKFLRGRWKALPIRTRRRLKRAVALVTVAYVSLVASINISVSYLGNTTIFPLDPRSLDAKLWALQLYLRHRPVCAIWGEADVRDEAVRAALRHGVVPALMLAIVESESAFVPHRISWRGACGPAQLMPATAEELGVSDPFGPKEAIDGGARYIKQQLNRFGNVRLAVAAYNAGPGAVRGSVPQNGETEIYVERVMSRYQAHKRAREPKSVRSASGSK
jgi:soluble lytic murein transglycosylase-like protein